MIPGEFKKGDRLTADGLNRLVREIVSRTLSAGPGIRINRTPSGSTISATGSGGGSSRAPRDVAEVVTADIGGSSPYLDNATTLDGETTGRYLTCWNSRRIPASLNLVAIRVMVHSVGGE